MTDIPAAPATDGTRTEVEQEAFNAILDQLADPATLLANALMRIRKADAVFLVPLEDNTEDPDLVEIQALYRLGSAFVLRGIAEAAMALQEAPPHLQPRIPVNLDDYAARDAAQAYEPQATRLRFTVRLVGRDTSTAVWVPEIQQFVPKLGFRETDLTVTDQDKSASVNIAIRASGRIVSATPDHALCITDGGHTLTLPRRVLVESPDE